MKITTKAVYDIESGKLLEWGGYEYDGPLALCGGGPSGEQKAAAASQAKLTDQEAKTAAQSEAFKEAQQNKVNPFYTSRMTNGLPYLPAAMDYSGGTLERSYNPARAALIKSFGTNNALPSGFRTQALTDLESDKAHAYDDNLLGLLAANEQAKEAGASGLLGQAQLADPTAYFQLANGGNTSIMNAPLQSSGFAGVLGSLINAGATVGSKFIKPPGT